MNALDIIGEYLIGKTITVHRYDSTYDGVEVFNTKYEVFKYFSHGENIKYVGSVDGIVKKVINNLHKSDFKILIEIDNTEVYLLVDVDDNLTIK